MTHNKLKMNNKNVKTKLNPKKDRFVVLNSLKGIIPKDINENEIKKNRLLNK